MRPQSSSRAAGAVGTQDGRHTRRLGPVPNARAVSCTVPGTLTRFSASGSVRRKNMKQSP